MKCIIVDDEPLARQGMELLVKKIPDLEIAGVFSNVIDADNFLKENTIDIMFLDIQMPLLTGIDFLKILPNPPMIIITTAYPEYALESFEYNVIDYLTKPIKFERFYKSIAKCRHFIESSELLKEKELVYNDGELLFLRSNRKYVKVNLKNISHIEGLKDYVIVHHDNERLPLAINLKSIESKLPKNKFIRVNKSFIINIEFVKSIDNEKIILKNEEIFIGENYKEDLMNFIQNIGLIKRDY